MFCCRIYAFVLKGKKEELNRNKDFKKIKKSIKKDILFSEFGEVYIKFLFKIFKSNNVENTISFCISVGYIIIGVASLFMMSGLTTKPLFTLYIKFFEIILLILIFLGHQIIQILTKIINIINNICFPQKGSFINNKLEELQELIRNWLDYSRRNVINNTESPSDYEAFIQEDQSNNNDDEDENENKELYENGLFGFVKICLLRGMFEINKNTKHSKVFFVYKIIVTIIIVAIQFYSIIYPYKMKTLTGLHFASFVWMKMIFMYKVCAYNLIDGIIRLIPTMKSMFDGKAIIIYWAIVVLYISSFVGSFVFGSYFNQSSVYPTVNSARFIENNEKWFKLNNTQTIFPESYCLSQSRIDGTLKTEDFAMLTTLPRMYNFTADNKCYIKPSMRGLFNSTMKYIFGKDYENDNILIMCRKLFHYPVLIITSNKILQQSINYFSKDTKITYLKKQFDIQNTEYFFNDPIPIVNQTKEVQSYYYNYSKCRGENPNNKCESEWDIYTQNYWTNMYTDEFADIKGFERYQITLDSKMIIQPSFITDKGKLMAGTHYIVGGSFEDKWGVGLFMESFGRKYLPLLFGNFIPLYQFIRSHFRYVFLSVESFNRLLVDSGTIATKDMKLLTELYRQFNFSHDALYTVGHSISGTEMKGVSYFTDIQGIAFEASNGENIGYFDLCNLFSKSNNSVNNIVNIYSNKNIFSGFDQDCLINGELPERYYVPSVFDTACLTAISCSESKKYIPFCHQVLTQKGKDSVKEFNISFDAYLSKYDYL